MHIESELEEVDGRFNLHPETRLRIMPDLGTDSENYEVLHNAAIASRNARGLSLQIGLRLGGGARYIMDGLYGVGNTHIAIDPYGNIEYDFRDGARGRADYTNGMMHEALANLHLYALQSNIDFLFFPLEDTEFFDRFADGVPVYNQEKRVVNEYRLVVFDGPHAVLPVMTEVEFFVPRASDGAVFVFDDVQTYDHEAIDAFLLDKGWDRLETSPCKISYYQKPSA